MSTPNNSAYLSPNETLTDLTSPAAATTLDITKGLPENGNGKIYKHPFEGISNARRGLLMTIFATATALDVVNVSALVTATAQIARDLDLEAGNITWVYVYLFPPRLEHTAEWQSDVMQHHRLCLDLCRFPPLRRTTQ